MQQFTFVNVHDRKQQLKMDAWLHQDGAFSCFLNWSSRICSRWWNEQKPSSLRALWICRIRVAAFELLSQDVEVQHFTDSPSAIFERVIGGSNFSFWGLNQKLQ